MDIAELRKRSNEFLSNIDTWANVAIMDNAADIVQLNRDQMLSSKDAADSPITPKYSAPYAKKKGFNSPNLFLKGEMQGDMVLQVKGKEYHVGSGVEYTRYNTDRYGEQIFGVAPSSQPKAKGLTTPTLAELYESKVL